jgi:hypothetical protein
MVVDLSPETQQLLEACMKERGFRSADEAIFAGLTSLDQENPFDDFAPGELAALAEAGEESLRRHGGRPHEEVFAGIRARLAEKRKNL